MSRPLLRCAALVLLAVALSVTPARAAPDPSRATGISLISTLGPCAFSSLAFASDSPELGWTLASAGVFIGPATGYLYGGLPGRALVGIGARVACVGLFAVGVGQALDDLDSDRPHSGVLLLVAGGVGAVVSVVYDLAVVGHDVRVNNARHVTVLPWRSREGAAGLALRASF